MYFCTLSTSFSGIKKKKISHFFFGWWFYPISLAKKRLNFPVFKEWDMFSELRGTGTERYSRWQSFLWIFLAPKSHLKLLLKAVVFEMDLKIKRCPQVVVINSVGCCGRIVLSLTNFYVLLTFISSVTSIEYHSFSNIWRIFLFSVKLWHYSSMQLLKLI